MFVNYSIGFCMRLFSKILLLGLSLTLFGGALYAKDISVEDYIIGYEDKFIQHNIGPGAKITSFDERGNLIEESIFENPTVQALSLLYWTVGLYKIEDDRAVDLFVFTNECDIYKRFINDEIEWASVREATREYIEANKSEFPTRFEFVIPLKLKDYDERKRVFTVQDEFKISSIRRFEVLATDFNSDPCDPLQPKGELYPRAIVLEFSRPLSITSIPMDASVAKSYIQSTLQEAIDASYDGSPYQKLVYDKRKAFLFFKVKIFTHGKILGLNTYHLNTVQMLAVLEGYEIYEDMAKERLLYSRDFVSSSGKTSLNVGLKEQIAILKEKSEGKGILH